MGTQGLEKALTAGEEPCRGALRAEAGYGGPARTRLVARQASLRIATMQTLVGPLVDIAGPLIGGVTLAVGDHAPGEAVVWLLDQLEYEPVGRP